MPPSFIEQMEAANSRAIKLNREAPPEEPKSFMESLGMVSPSVQKKVRDVYKLNPTKECYDFAKKIMEATTNGFLLRYDGENFLARWIMVECGGDISAVTKSKELGEELGPLQISTAECVSYGMLRSECFDPVAICDKYLQPLIQKAVASIQKSGVKYASTDEFGLSVLLLAKLAHGSGAGVLSLTRKDWSMSAAGADSKQLPEYISFLARNEADLHPSRPAKHVRAAMYATGLKRNLADEIVPLPRSV